MHQTAQQEIRIKTLWLSIGWTCNRQARVDCARHSRKKENDDLIPVAYKNRVHSFLIEAQDMNYPLNTAAFDTVVAKVKSINQIDKFNHAPTGLVGAFYHNYIWQSHCTLTHDILMS